MSNGSKKKGYWSILVAFMFVIVILWSLDRIVDRWYNVGANSYIALISQIKDRAIITYQSGGEEDKQLSIVRLEGGKLVVGDKYEISPGAFTQIVHSLTTPLSKESSGWIEIPIQEYDGVILRVVYDPDFIGEKQVLVWSMKGVLR